MHGTVKKLNNVASCDAACIEVSMKSYMPNYTKPTYDTPRFLVLQALKVPVQSV